MKTLLALLGSTSLLLAGCGTTPPLVVNRDRLVVIEPPASCTAAVDWDEDFEPYGQPNRALGGSWASRGDSLAVANERLACVRSAIETAKRALSGAPTDP
jgi:hypothetical protein